MSGTKDLNDLLARLKNEVGHVAGEKEPKPRAEPPAAGPQPQPQAKGYESFRRPHRLETPREAPPADWRNPAWSENKESMLFGMLASLTAALGGVLAGLDYLALIGTVFFALFSLVMVLALLRAGMNFKRAGELPGGLAERVDALSKKVEMLSSRAASGGGVAHSAGVPERERELERRVEELRVLVKSLTKAVGLE